MIYFPNEQLIKLNTVFNAIDIEHEGFITEEKLKLAFIKIGINLNEEESKNIIKR